MLSQTENTKLPRLLILGFTFWKVQALARCLEEEGGAIQALNEEMIKCLDRPECRNKKNPFSVCFRMDFDRGICRTKSQKLGQCEQKKKGTLVQSFLEWMQEADADFTNTFAALDPTSAQPAFDDSRILEWQHRWQQRLDNPEESLALVQGANPAVVPWNHKVEEALEAAVQRGDLRPARRLLEVLAVPYDRTQNRKAFATPRPKDLPSCQTFCGNLT